MTVPLFWSQMPVGIRLAGASLVYSELKDNSLCESHQEGIGLFKHGVCVCVQ